MDWPLIELGTCRIRPLRLEDAGSIARVADDREVWITLRDRFPHPYGVEDAHWFIKHSLRSTWPELAIEVEGEAVGAIGLMPGEDVCRQSAEIGYWLGRAYWGRGIASLAVRALTERGLAVPEIRRIYATVFASNLASSRVLEKAGYTLEGRLRSSIVKDGQVQDSLLYAIVRG